MARVSAPHRGDCAGVARSRQPVVNRSPDLAAPNRGLALPRMAGDQQHDTVAGGNRPVEPEIDRIPSPVEVEAVKIDHPVRTDRARSKPPVPGRVESCGLAGNAGWLRRGQRSWCRRRHSLGDRVGRCVTPCPVGFQRLTGEWADRCCHTRPQPLLFRVERAHAPPTPWVATPAPGRMPPFHRRSGGPPAPLPRTCPGGWRP